jgi:GTP cyclohydrolase I
MIQYGSCPRGCGEQVAFLSTAPEEPLDRDEFTPHECLMKNATRSEAQKLAAAAIADLGQLAAFGPGHVTMVDDSNAADAARELRRASLMEAATTILRAIGEDPTREGLLDTPKRFAKMWLDFAEGVAGDEDYERTFEHQATSQMVIVHGLRVWSMCEHHLLPFWMDVAVGYISTGRVLGLSKFGRIARHCGAKLGMQERYVEEVADVIAKVAQTDNVMVVAEGKHLCMLSRGSRMDHTMTSSAARGLFLEAGNAARNEFLHLTSKRRE